MSAPAGWMLRGALLPEQKLLLETIFEPFDASGTWPIWQYVDLKLDAASVDAASVFASLPRARDPHIATIFSGYGLVWYMNPSATPQPDQQVALTVAGMSHLTQCRSLIAAFLRVVNLFVTSQSQVIPSPVALVEATVRSDEVYAHLTDFPDLPANWLDMLRESLEYEPVLYSGIRRPSPDSSHWSFVVPPAIRWLREIEGVDDYIDRIVQLSTATRAPSPGRGIAPLALPYSVGYLNAVWKSESGQRLFADLDAVSVARLTQPCTSEGDFNSLLSALADVLSRVVVPGKNSPPQGGALEAFRDYLTGRLEPTAITRVSRELDRLVRIRHLRVATQHSDARHKAVAAFSDLGMSFPPPSWDQAWSHIAALAAEALDVVREEVGIGLWDDATQR